MSPWIVLGWIFVGWASIVTVVSVLGILGIIIASIKQYKHD